MEEIVSQLFATGMAGLVTLVVQVIKGVWPLKWGELSEAGTILIAFVASEIIIGGQKLTSVWPPPTPADWYAALVIDPIVGTLLAVGVYQVGVKSAVKLNMIRAQRRALRQQNLKNKDPYIAE